MAKIIQNPFEEKGVRREVFDVLRRRKSGVTFNQLLDKVMTGSKKRSKKSVAHKVRLVLSPALETKYGYKLNRKLVTTAQTRRAVIQYTLTRSTTKRR